MSVGSSTLGRRARRSFSRATMRARGLGRFLADRLDHRLVKLLDDPQIHQRPGDGQLQSELLADFAGELQDHICEGGAIAAFSSGLLHRPAEFLIDHLLHAFQPRGGRELLLDDVIGAFKGDDTGGEVAHSLEALMNRGFADAEVAGGVGLRVAGLEVGAEPVVGELGRYS